MAFNVIFYIKISFETIKLTHLLYKKQTFTLTAFLTKKGENQKNALLTPFFPPVAKTALIDSKLKSL